MSDKVLSTDLYINRELSWIAFNERVLIQALDERTPLLEQAKFSAHPCDRNRSGHTEPAQSCVAPTRLGRTGNGTGKPSGTAEPGEFSGSPTGWIQLRPAGTDQSIRGKCLSADHGDVAGGRQSPALKNTMTS